MNTTGSARPAAEVAAGLGTVLGVWAHPDDEAYLSGGLMAAAVDAGSRVVCVTATRGELGSPDGRPAVGREAELAASLEVLGVTDLRQLGYPDGGCVDVPVAAAVSRLTAIIEEVRPDTVLTFGPDGMTGHADHRIVCRWATDAVRQSEVQPRLLYATHTDTWCDRFAELHSAVPVFPPGLPPRVPAREVAVDVVLPDHLLDRKMAALHAHASQVIPLVEVVGDELFRSWVANESFCAAEPFPRRRGDTVM